MSNDKLTELEDRLAVAERELEKTRTQVRTLQEQARPRARGRNGILTLFGLVLVFAATRALDTQAQGKPQPLTVRAPFQVVDASGKIMLTVASGAPNLTVGEPAAGGVTLGTGKSGAGFVIIRTPAGEDAIGLGQYRAAPAGVYVIGPDGVAVEASVATGPKGGAVKVMNPNGVVMAGLATVDSGGGLALTGPAGGPAALSLSVNASGGKVQVFPQAGGSAQAELLASPDGGAQIVYNKKGEAVAWLEATPAGNGRFELGRAGKVYVEAAVLESGLGMVATGPEMGGAPPGMVIPNYLQGRTKR